MKRSLKDGSKFIFLTKTVSSMSNTGIAKICLHQSSSERKISIFMIYILYSINDKKKHYNVDDLIASNNVDDHK